MEAEPTLVQQASLIRDRKSANHLSVTVTMGGLSGTSFFIFFFLRERERRKNVRCKHGGEGQSCTCISTSGLKHAEKDRRKPMPIS